MHVVLAALAVLWAWEYLLILSPVGIPPVLQPLIVAAGASGAAYAPDRVLTACAVAGAVALLHRALTAPGAPQVVSRRPPRRMPPL